LPFRSIQGLGLRISLLFLLVGKWGQSNHIIVCIIYTLPRLLPSRNDLCFSACMKHKPNGCSCVSNRLGEVRKLFLEQVEVGSVDAGIPEALAEDARLGGRRGCETPTRAEGPLVLDGRNVAYAVDVAQVEASGNIASLSRLADATSRQMAGIGESGRPHTAKRQQHEKRENDGILAIPLMLDPAFETDE